MVVSAFKPVTAGAATAPTAANLLASAVVPNEPDERWVGGVALRSELCPALQLFDPCGTLETVPEAGTDGTYFARGVGYRVSDECSRLDGPPDTARLTRLAAAVASYAVAEELWSGALTRSAPFDAADISGTPTAGLVNPYLMSPDAEVIAETPGNLMEALGILEEAARQVTKGMTPVLHLPLRYLVSVGAQLRRVGNELRTPTDAIVVGDAGYTGDGPYGAGTSEVQTVTLTGGPTGGTFTLTYDGQTTAPIPFDATAGAVQSALVALPNLNTGDVTVTGSGPWTVTFAAALGNVGQMTGDGSGLTGGTTPSVTVTTTTPGAAGAPQAGRWAYATGPVTARLGTIQPLADNATFDRRTNKVRIWAERPFLVTFDPCAHFAIRLDA